MKGLIATVVIVVLLLGMIGSCSGASSKSSDRYRQNMESGLQKYYNGEKMNEEEYNAVKDYQNWKYKNSEHTYDDWNK